MLKRAILLLAIAVASPVLAQDFTYYPPGQLQPAASGVGDAGNRKIYAPAIGLPIRLQAGENLYPNSQVYRPGGMYGGGGSQCDPGNYAMPWSDNFCEARNRGTFLCPGGTGHQGVDIRPPSCKDKAAVAVAVEDGVIIGRNDYTSSVTLKGRKTGNTYIYLHLDPPSIAVNFNDKVKAGDALGKVSNFMNGAHSTTVHLHFEIKQTVQYKGAPLFTHVPPYASLVHAYRAKLALPSLNGGGVLGVDPVRETSAPVLAAGTATTATTSTPRGKRVALVIGNSAYQQTPRLENPKHDAADVAAALKQLGFEVMDGVDLDKAAMDRKIRDFAAAIEGAETGLLFYAGHGLQVGGQNYLVPVDAKLTTASGLDFEMVRLDLIQRTMERATKTNLIFLDACRDNPLARNLARAMGTRSAEIGRGLAAAESGVGTLISYSTQPGNVALDGAGHNSPFAGALVKLVGAPDEDLASILINVRKEVMAATQGRQIPWEHSALTARFYFIPPKSAAREVELTYWASVKDSTSPAVLGTYLERYPDGEFASIARALIEHYEGQRKAELAAREEARRRLEEERKAAEVKRLEEERRSREEAIAEERKRAEEAKSLADIQRLDEKARAEWLARTEELRKALEEVRLAREAAKAAEEQRLAALKAAEQATKAAEEAIAKKRETEKTGDAAKVAVLPKIEKPTGVHPFDGTWTITWRGEPCGPLSTNSYPIRIEGGVVVGKSGSVAPSGAARWTQISSYTKGVSVSYSGTFRGGAGSGTFQNPRTPCRGTWTALRN